MGLAGHLIVWSCQVMESVVKNCGQTVHDEVASKQTMEELKELLKVRGSVREKTPNLGLGFWVSPGACGAEPPMCPQYQPVLGCVEQLLSCLLPQWDAGIWPERGLSS